MVMVYVFVAAFGAVIAMVIVLEPTLSEIDAEA
jgi:hypothetical protein